MLPVGEDAVSGRQNRALLWSPQSEHEAADARVGAAAEEVGHLHPCGQRTVQVLHKVPDGYVDVRAVANHQSVDRHPVEAVVSRPTKLRLWWISLSVSAALKLWVLLCRTWRFRQTVFLQHVPEEDFEELLKSQPHLKIKQWAVARSLLTRDLKRNIWNILTNFTESQNLRWPISSMVLQWCLMTVLRQIFIFIVLYSIY